MTSVIANIAKYVACLNLDFCSIWLAGILYTSERNLLNHNENNDPFVKTMGEGIETHM